MVGKQSLILVTIDSLRADHCSFMGYDRETTPTLDEMARDGLVFRNAIAPGPSTSESMPAIFTGHYPYERNVSSVAIEERISRIRPHMRAQQTLAEQFSEAGYSTAAFTPNPFTTRYFGFDQGFDHFQDFLSGSRGKLYEWLIKRAFKESKAYMPVRVLFNWLKKEEVFKPWEAFYDQVIGWIRSTDCPYFVWVFLMDVHHPYLANTEHRSISIWENIYANWKLRSQNYEPPFSTTVTENLITAYDDSIKYADAFLQRLSSDVQEEDPIIVVTSDHGEAFGEHGTYEHHGGAFGKHGKQEYHSYLYEENIHVPFVITNADRQETVERPFSLRSLGNLLKVTNDDLRIDTDVTRDFVTAQTMTDEEIAVRGHRWKYIRETDDESVYDLGRDEITPIDDGQLLELMGSLADSRLTAERECQRIVDASSTVAENNSV